VTPFPDVRGDRVKKNLGRFIFKPLSTCSVANREYVDLDPAFHFDYDPNPGFHQDAFFGSSNFNAQIENLFFKSAPQYHF